MGTDDFPVVLRTRCGAMRMFTVDADADVFPPFVEVAILGTCTLAFERASTPEEIQIETRVFQREKRYFGKGIKTQRVIFYQEKGSPGIREVDVGEVVRFVRMTSVYENRGGGTDTILKQNADLAELRATLERERKLLERENQSHNDTYSELNKVRRELQAMKAKYEPTDPERRRGAENGPSGVAKLPDMKPRVIHYGGNEED